jgi:hypothetical protein
VIIGDFDKFWWRDGSKNLIKICRENVRETPGYGDIKRLVVKYMYKTTQNSEKQIFQGTEN